MASDLVLQCQKVVSSKQVSAILDQLFLGTDNTYSINDRQITIYHKGEQPNSQQQSNKFTVTGVITDAQGESMIGVSVKVKGTTLGGISDMDGRYSISVPNKNDILIVSFLGYATEEIKINGRRNINIRFNIGDFYEEHHLLRLKGLMRNC